MAVVEEEQDSYHVLFMRKDGKHAGRVGVVMNPASKRSIRVTEGEPAITIQNPMTFDSLGKAQSWVKWRKFSQPCALMIVQYRDDFPDGQAAPDPHEVPSYDELVDWLALRGDEVNASGYPKHPAIFENVSEFEGLTRAQVMERYGYVVN